MGYSINQSLIHNEIFPDKTGESGVSVGGDIDSNEMLVYSSVDGNIVGTGDTNTVDEVNFGSKKILCKTVETEAQSVFIGGGIRLSDRGGYLNTVSNITGDTYLPLESKLTNNGSENPLWSKREALVQNYEVQDDFSNQLFDVHSYSFTPVVSQDVIKVHLKLINPITNFRARITSAETGDVVKYIPSRHDFNKGIGFDFASGDIQYEIPSGIGEVKDIEFTVEMFADQPIDLLGSQTEPWRAIDYMVIENIPVLSSENIYGFNTDGDEQQKLVKKEYVDELIASSIRPKGGYNADTNTPNLESAPTGVLEGYMYIVTEDGQFFTKNVTVGDSMISLVDDPQSESDWIVLVRHLNASTIKSLYESNSDTNAFTDDFKLLLENFNDNINSVIDSRIHTITSPTLSEYHSSNQNIIYGGFLSTGLIRERNLSTNIDKFYQSTVPTDLNNWADWNNRETLIYVEEI